MAHSAPFLMSLSLRPQIIVVRSAHASFHVQMKTATMQHNSKIFLQMFALPPSRVWKTFYWFSCKFTIDSFHSLSKLNAIWQKFIVQCELQIFWLDVLCKHVYAFRYIHESKEQHRKWRWNICHGIRMRTFANECE